MVLLGPEKTLQFNALESLIYEGKALDESPDNRLDFTTSSISDVKKYLRQSPDIIYDFPNFKAIKGDRIERCFYYRLRDSQNYRLKL